MDSVPHAVSRGSFWFGLGCRDILGWWYVFPQIKSKDTVHLQTSIQWNNLCFCTTVEMLLSCIYPHDNVVDSHSCDEYRISSELSQARVHLVTPRASLFTDQRMSGLPIRAKYKHFKTMREQTSDMCPTDSKFLFLEMVIIQARTWNFVYDAPEKCLWNNSLGQKNRIRIM